MSIDIVHHAAASRYQEKGCTCHRLEGSNSRVAAKKGLTQAIALDKLTALGIMLSLLVVPSCIKSGGTTLIKSNYLPRFCGRTVRLHERNVDYSEIPSHDLY